MNKVKRCIFLLQKYKEEQVPPLAPLEGAYLILFDFDVTKNNITSFYSPRTVA